MRDISDLRATIIPKSDQLNAEQLLGGPMTITVTDVRIGSSDEQPISIHYEDDAGRPYKPCKTMRKVLIFAWGQDGREWMGRSMTLYNDPSVRFGGAEVGGIRISHISDVERDLQVSLTATKGKKALHTIKRLEVARGPSLAEVLQAIAAATNKATMTAAKALAGQLTRPADISAAVDAYNARAAALKPKPAAAKTLAQFTEDIDNATDAEAAGQVLESARDLLTPTEFEQLTQALKAAWD